MPRCDLKNIHIENNPVSVTHYGMDCPGLESRCRRNFPYPSRPTLKPTQPPIRWLPGLFQWVKRPGSDVDHPPPPHLAPSLKKG